MNGPELPMWTIYDHPLDHPDKYVVRRYTITRNGPVADTAVQLADTLEQARELIPPGLYNLGRYDTDEPQIVETWI